VNEFFKSFSSLSLALALFPVKQIESILTTDGGDYEHGPATEAMDSITHAVVNQFGGTLKATFSALDNLQRGVIALCANASGSWGAGNRIRQTHRQTTA